MHVSRTKRRKLIYLIYCICAKENPECEIKQDPLVKRYPDINYGLTIITKSGDEARHLQKTILTSLDNLGFEIYTCKVHNTILDVAGFYHKGKINEF